MAINIKFDTAGNPEPPSIILATKNGNKLGLLDVNADSIELNDKLKVSEISFTLNKYINGKLNNLWDKVVDFKLIWCKEWDTWFEIKVELDEATETVKTIFGTQLGQAELSQIMVYNMEINTEEDIARDDYKITILYDENDHEASLLHRVLKDKAPHYSIAYVDPTIARMQRQFSWDGSSICDTFDEIEEEIGCLVVYNSNSTKGGMPNRSISVYDLEQNCNDCGHRGEFTDKCPKCGSKNIKSGYGEDTTIFVTADELASEGIQLVADVDSVKNCFKLEAGDDLMTATIRNCNPNGSDYIWRFSEDIKADMSEELVKKLESYDAEYKRYYNEHESNLDAILLTQYNNLVEKYDDFYNTKSTCLSCGKEDYFYDKCSSCKSENLLTGKELQKIFTPVVGYPSLMNAYYNTIDFALYLESGLMPSIEMSDTTAEKQAELLTTASLSPVAVNVKEIGSITEPTANSAVLSMAKVIVKSTYKVEILTSSLSTEKKWSGTFKITNYSDDTDNAEVVVNDIVVNNNAETFIKQKIEKALNKENTDDYSISGLFEKEYDEFCEEIKKYGLNPLQSFYDAADACISILTEQGAGDETNKPDLYENLYLPYFQKQEAIASEISIRKNELATIEGTYDETTKTTTGGLQNNIKNCQSVIQNALNFEKYLGADLWKEFCSFRREDKYSNSNYTSDGLNNAQLFQRALEFIEVAENEIYKSSELQHSISTSLNNLLAIDKFKPLVKYFKNGNWIRIRVDDKIYKLRLLEYGINFGSFESISVEFSDVTKVKNGITDVKDIIEQASSMASSYDAVTRQAKKGNVARSTIDQWIDEGLNAANVQIQSNDSEEILITKNGLLGRSYDDITGTYLPEQLKITHNLMAYTDDNWQTVKQAIGKHKYNLYNKDENKFVEEIGYGMNADFVVAGVVSGSQIIGGDVYSDNYSITNRTGSYLNLRDGTFSFGGGALRFEGGELLISSPNVVTKNEVTTINEEYLKTTSVYAENLRVNAAYIQEKLTASQINTKGLIAENISSTTIDGKTITGGSILIGDTTKVGNYAEIANDGTLTCTNVNIKGGTLAIGSKDDEETHTWISTDGTLNTYNANIQGTLTSSTIIGGTINGSTLNVGKILDEEGNHTGDYYTTITDDGYLKSVDGEFENCTIVGGSLKMGTTSDGYHTWISSDGILNASGANIDGKITAVEGAIAGWQIDEDKIFKDDMMLTTSNDLTYQSLITNTQSPVRINVGETPGGIQNVSYYELQTQDYETIDGKITLYFKMDTTVTYAKLIDYGCSDEDYIDAMFGAATIEISDDTIILHIENPDQDENIGFGFTIEYMCLPKFCLLGDGSLYASAADITGTINATDGEFTGTVHAQEGNIGNLQISGGGLTFNEANTDVYSLNDAGLILEKSSARIQVGDLMLGYDTSENATLIKTSGHLILRADNDTQIEFMKDSSSITASSDVSIWYQRTGSDINSEVFIADVWITSNSAPLYPASFNIAWQALENDWGTLKVLSSGTVNLTIPVGATQSNVVTIHYDYSATEGVQFKTSSGSWTSMSTSTTATNLGVVNSFSQTQSPQNLYFKGNLFPSTTSTSDSTGFNIGDSDKVWNTIYARTSTIQTSDKNAKYDIFALDNRFEVMFDELIPVSYKLIINDSERSHIGLVAQDVKQAIINAELTTQEFAGYCEWTNDDGTIGCGLRYSEFIALCINEIQKLKKRISELEK